MKASGFALLCYRADQMFATLTVYFAFSHHNFLIFQENPMDVGANNHSPPRASTLLETTEHPGQHLKTLHS